MRFCLNSDGTDPVELGPHMEVVLDYPDNGRHCVFLMSFLLAGTCTRIYQIDDSRGQEGQPLPTPQDKVILTPKVPHLRIAKGCIEDFLSKHGFTLGERVHEKGPNSRIYPIEPLVHT